MQKLRSISVWSVWQLIGKELRKILAKVFVLREYRNMEVRIFCLVRLAEITLYKNEP